jgi:hypothetical protein
MNPPTQEKPMLSAHDFDVNLDPDDDGMENRPMKPERIQR